MNIDNLLSFLSLWYLALTSAEHNIIHPISRSPFKRNIIIFLEWSISLAFHDRHGLPCISANNTFCPTNTHLLYTYIFNNTTWFDGNLRIPFFIFFGTSRPDLMNSLMKKFLFFLSNITNHPQVINISWTQDQSLNIWYWWAWWNNDICFIVKLSWYIQSSSYNITCFQKLLGDFDMATMAFYSYDYNL